MNWKLIVCTATAAVLAACGGSGNTEQTGSASSTTAKSAPAAEAASARGVGPIKSVDVAALDMSRAAAGETTFTAMCTACHKIEERYIGPALAGVTQRRTPEWIMNMILNPDVMVKEDPTAKALFAEYLAPMTDQNLSEAQAKDILTYFLHHDREEGEEGEHEESDHASH